MSNLFITVRCSIYLINISRLYHLAHRTRTYIKLSSYTRKAIYKNRITLCNIYDGVSAFVYLYIYDRVCTRMYM